MEQHSGTRSRDNGRDREALAHEAEAQMEELRARVADLNERALTFVKDRPVTALLIAAGAGFLFGRILRS